MCVVCNKIHEVDEVGASKLAETCRIYCFSNTSVDTKILSIFRPCCSGPLEDLCLEATRSKHQQDFCFHAGTEETVYPINKIHILLSVLQQK